jgi:hypothetical protein
MFLCVKINYTKRDNSIYIKQLKKHKIYDFLEQHYLKMFHKLSL